MRPESEPRPVEPKPRRDRDGLHKRRAIWHYKLKVDGRWREFSTGTREYRVAQVIRRSAIQDHEAGQLPADSAKQTLAQAVPDWLEERKTLMARNTWQTESHLSKNVLASLGGKRLCDISASDIRRYQVSRRSKVSARTVNLEVRIVRAILHQQKLWGRLADDFKALPERSRGPGRALTEDQERRLFESAASRPAWEAAYYAALLATNTTARGCELKGLRLGDIDLDECSMTIQRASTKTDAGSRIVPLNTTAKWAIARLLERAERLGATAPDH